MAHARNFVQMGWMVNAAYTGTSVREKSFWESGGGESVLYILML